MPERQRTLPLVSAVPPEVLIVAAVTGACVGSFLNVCVHRLPRNESVVHPPSRCYSCGTRIQWYDNIPILSYLALAGRCRWCGSRFGPRYLLGEAAVACLSVLALWYAFSLALLPRGMQPNHWLFAGAVAPCWSGALAGAATLCAIAYVWVNSLIDLEHGIIPDELTKPMQVLAPLLALALPTNLMLGWNVQSWFVSTTGHMEPAGLIPMGLLVGAALAVLLLSLPLARWIYARFAAAGQDWGEDDHRGLRIGVLFFVLATAVHMVLLVGLTAAGAALGHHAWALAAGQLAQAILGSLAGWLILYLIGLAGTIGFRRNAMGFGDVKFLAPLGALLGPVGLLYAFLFAVLSAVAIGLPCRLANRAREIPFGPFLGLGALATAAWGPWVQARVFAALFGF